MKRLSLLSCILFFTLECLSQHAEPTYTLYLLGDAGKVTEGQTNTINVIKSQLRGSSEGIIFLGDNIYQQGMPEKGHQDRENAEGAIDAQIDLAQNFNGDSYFIPGNHDWAQGRNFGWSQVIRQEKYIEDRLDSMNIFLPNEGCPGPVKVDINEELMLVLIDTQWFLHHWDKPTAEIGGCEFSTAAEVLQALDQMLAMNQHKKIVVATHHPMFTYGEHGGVFQSKYLFMPPVIGGLYPLYRSAFGSVQDIPNPIYKAVRNSIVSIMENYPNTIHAAGHEHSLQYSTKDEIHYIVSGSGSKTTYVKKKGYAEFAESVNGFSKINFYADGKTELEVWRSDNTMAFKKVLRSDKFRPRLSESEFTERFDLTDSTLLMHASNQYKAGASKVKFFGENYRKEWEQDIEVPVFDIGEEHGGLKIVQRGGGQQTKSLRLQAENGKQYVLRSIEKYAEGAIPAFLVNTFAEDLVQDQISSSHPYGAFVVPYLAEAAGIYHTNPKIVFIPDDPRFGPHQPTFANTLALYEERPAKDWSDADFFGNSPDIENTAKVLSNLAKDNDNYVDEPFVVKSRLFDMLIGDWDRHDDQWRWAEVEDGKGYRYRPIPRDRDQAFFVNEGLLPSIWKRKWALPKFEGFDEEIDWPSGLSFNARYFDRSFLSSLEREDWIAAAEDLKKTMTDEVIEEAIKKWPKPIYDLHGERIISHLKARREKLTEYAVEHYLFLSKEVNVLGSNKHEHFKAERLPNGDVKVRVRKMNKEGDKKKELFERTFKNGETKEIRLFALDGDDEIEIEGEGKRGIKIRVIGGDGEDELDDDSKVKNALVRQNIFYDTKTGNKLKLNSESRNRLSNDPAVNEYNRKEFKYDILMPLVTGGYNFDDGVILGGGFLYTHHGFRKEPFKSRHRVMGSYAFNTSAYNFNYLGEFTDVIRSWDFNADVVFNVPDYVNNFFGLGNESIYNQNIDEIVDIGRSIDYYRVRFQEISYEVGFFRSIGSYAKFGITHDLVSWELQQDFDQPNYINDEFIPSIEFDGETSLAYLGGGIRFDVDTRKNRINPTAGILWTNKINTLYDIKGGADDFHEFNSSLSLYHSFKLPARLTFAARIGWGKNFGDYPFFRGQTIGGTEQVRGYRKTRFYGDETFYSNIEARLKLFTLKSYVLPAAIGILGFHDVGRVWLEGEDSDKWHRGVGGGVWLTPFGLAVVSAELGVSEEETLFYIRIGHMF